MTKFIHKFKVFAYTFLHNTISLFFPVKKKKVLFKSFLGLYYSDNPRAISEKLHEIDPSYEIIWAFQNPNLKKRIVPSYVKCVKINSFEYYFHEATSGFWVDNYCLPLHTLKRKGQKYIQTWHGDRALKNVLHAARPEVSTMVLYETDHCDLAVAGSHFGENTYRVAFKYNGRILTEGSPRNDILIQGDDEAVNLFKQQYNIPDDVKLLLFAPTFRDNAENNIQLIKDLDMEQILDLFSSKTGKKWVLLLRGHTGRQLVFKGLPKNVVYDVTDYEDTKYVLLASDAIISDFSSIVSDFILRKKPTFLYIKDLKDYIENSRTLSIDLKKSPFWYASNQDDLIALINKYTDLSVVKNCESLFDFFNINETGNASEAVCRYIISGR